MNMPKKLTLDFCKEEALKNGYEITDEKYINNSTYLNFIHLDCGFNFPMWWSNFNEGQRCPECARKIGSSKRKLELDFCKSEAKKRGFLIMEEKFINSKEKMKFFSIECEHYFYMDWSHFYHRGYGCLVCNKSKSPTIEFCKKYSKERGYNLTTDFYLNQNQAMNFVHLECGNIFNTSWKSFHGGETGCPKCYGNEKLTLEYCKEYSESCGYKLLDNAYINSSLKMNFEHKECGFNFSMKWSHFQQGHGCPLCGGSKTLTIDYCKNYAKRYGYTIKDKKYINARQYMNFIHDECGFCFPVVWNSFQRGTRCPKCASELKESYVATNLKQYYSEYFSAIPEYEECINPKTGWFLPYDIFIPKYNFDGYDIFIEVQGEQHYEFNSMFHKTQKDFKYQQYKDQIKKDYAEQNGIYIEIDLRQKTPIEGIIEKINNTITRYG